MKEPIRVGLLGYGFASKTFHAPLIATTPGMTLAAISSRDANNVHADWPAVTVAADPAVLFADPTLDLIVIPTPNDTHYPLAKAALLAGKHVVVDKPFTLTVAEAQDLEQLAAHQQRLLSVFHNRRWDSDFLTLKALLASGELGQVRYLESRIDRFRPEVRQRWREMAGEGSGIWYDLAPHLLDQALQLFGPPQALGVDLAELRPGAQTTDYFQAVLYYADRRVVLSATMLAAAETPRFQVHGTAGSYVKWGMDPQEERLKAGARPAAGWGRDDRDGTLTRADAGGVRALGWPTEAGNYPAYYAAVGEAIRGRADNPVTPAQAIAVMALIERGIEAARERRVLPVV
ncbi:oxidoreductase [Pantoea sp. 1.19]|uniref:oxidoreductase n=1 Tax=Pantoea sp. 1.19 TaxID=1925589 RepID=UPI000948ED62|nr:oxidoreductase [Pantoea sp. 1.19]